MPLFARRILLNRPLRSGLTFGLTSGVITTLGLMVGLHAGTHSKLAVAGGILTIAVADALSDALGMHISQESDQRTSARDVWTATAATFAAKLIMALTFLMPVVFFELATAIIVSVLWGMLVLTVLSYHLARSAQEPAWKVVSEHLAIAMVVVIATHFVGDLANEVFQ